MPLRTRGKCPEYTPYFGVFRSLLTTEKASRLRSRGSIG